MYSMLPCILNDPEEVTDGHGHVLEVISVAINQRGIFTCITIRVSDDRNLSGWLVQIDCLNAAVFTKDLSSGW